MDRRSVLSPLSDLMVWPCEALGVLVVVVAVLLPVDMAEDEVAAAVAGREESFASVYSHMSFVSIFFIHNTLGL